VFGCDRGPESRVQTLFLAVAEAARLGNEAAKNKSVPGFPQWGFEVRDSPEFSHRLINKKGLPNRQAFLTFG
jgi:hypothetical protein